MRLIRATADDFDRIADFYRFVIDNTETMERYCRWVYGEHPADDLIRRYIDEGAMFYSVKGDELLSAVVVLPYQEEDYHGIDWMAELEDDDVAAVHILCVNPLYSKQGLGTATMKAVVENAEKTGKKAVRLDTLLTNLAGQHLYESLGFTRICVKYGFAACTGWTDFVMYEKLI